MMPAPRITVDISRYDDGSLAIQGNEVNLRALTEIGSYDEQQKCFDGLSVCNAPPRGTTSHQLFKEKCKHKPFTTTNQSHVFENRHNYRCLARFVVTSRPNNT